MKEIKAIIQPFMLDVVLDALHNLDGLPGITLSEARGKCSAGALRADRQSQTGDHAEKAAVTKAKATSSDAAVTAKTPIGLLTTVGVDIAIDGLLIGIGFAAGAKTGVLITIALTLKVPVAAALSLPQLPCRTCKRRRL